MTALKVGDVIEVQLREIFGVVVRERWVGAVILEIGHSSYLVRPLRANEEAFKQMRVPFDQFGHLWRGQSSSSTRRRGRPAK